MRLTILAFALLPMGALAQNLTDAPLVEEVQQSQSCSDGAVWDSTTQSCVVAEQALTPADGMLGDHDCSGSQRATSVTS